MLRYSADAISNSCFPLYTNYIEIYVGVRTLLQFGIMIPLEINLFLLSNDLIVLFCDRWSFGVLLWEIESGGKQF